MDTHDLESWKRRAYRRILKDKAAGVKPACCARGRKTPSRKGTER